MGFYNETIYDHPFQPGIKMKLKIVADPYFIPMLLTPVMNATVYREGCSKQLDVCSFETTDPKVAIQWFVMTRFGEGAVSAKERESIDLMKYIMEE